MKRKLIEVLVGGYFNLNSKNIDGSKIKRVWSVYDENTINILNSNEKSLEEIPLKHNQGVFLEDKVHDWDVTKDNMFRYYTRIAEPNELMKVILEVEKV